MNDKDLIKAYRQLHENYMGSETFLLPISILCSIIGYFLLIAGVRHVGIAVLEPILIIASAFFLKEAWTRKAELETLKLLLEKDGFYIGRFNNSDEVALVKESELPLNNHCVIESELNVVKEKQGNGNVFLWVPQGGLTKYYKRLFQ